MNRRVTAEMLRLSVEKLRKRQQFIPQAAIKLVGIFIELFRCDAFMVR
jgi:hypothetical protein